MIGSINVSFACPQCEQGVRVEVPVGATTIGCPACRGELALPPGAYVDGELHRCLVCPSTDLFVRKDFPQRLGVTIVTIGFLVSCVTWYNYWLYATFAALFATALIDVTLWFLVPNCLHCYRCDAQYRGLQDLYKHQGFNLETHERYRQQAIRLQQAERRSPLPVISSPSEPRT